MRAPVYLSLLVLISGCPVYDEGVPTPGEYSTCCVESTHSLDTHKAAEGELATAGLFPGCSCDRGPRCDPYISTEQGCSLRQSGTMDAGVGPADAGTSLDAGTSGDAGRPDAGAADAGNPNPSDAGAPGTWAACCVSGRVAPCLCPGTGACPASKFKACAGGTCSLSGSCST